MADPTTPTDRAAQHLQYLLTSVLREGNFFGGGKQFQREVESTITALARAIGGPLQQQINEQASQIAQLQTEIARLKNPPDAPDAEAL